MRYTYLILFSSLLSVTALTGQNCFDGIQNGDETGIDCGAPGCEPCSDFYNDIFAEDFESGYGEFTEYYTVIQEYSGRQHVRLGSFAHLTSPGIDLSQFSEVSIEFAVRPVNLYAGANLELQVSNGGSSYTTVKRWYKGDDLPLSYNEIKYKFAGPLSSNISFRFRWNGTYSTEYFYIDYFYIREYYKAKVPSCHDGIQNGDETGIDCGGSCEPCIVTGEKCDQSIINTSTTNNYTSYWSLTGNNNYYNKFGYFHFTNSEGYFTTLSKVNQANKTLFEIDVKERYSNIDGELILERSQSPTSGFVEIMRVQASYTRGILTLEDTNIDNDYYYRLRTPAAGYLYIYSIKTKQEVCNDLISAPQWAGSRTLDSTLYRSGSVSIGVPDPGSYKLAVNGDIRAQKVRVEQDGWPDYVFQPQYQLPELPAVEQYIQQHGHLKDIPSAETVQAEGIDLGEMDKRLLEKIEQLTLYMIQMDKEVKALREENKALREENKTIKNRLKKLEH